MKTAIRVLVMLAASLSCQLACAAGLTGPLQILGMDVGDTSALYLRLSGNTECGDSLAYVSANQPYYKDVLALAAMAYSTGQSVRIWVSSCNGSNAQIARFVVGSVW